MIKEEGGKFCLYTSDGSRKIKCHDTREQAEAQEAAINARRGASARTLRAAVSSPQEIRHATFDGRDHLVVPVVALVEGVIQASNSDGPEFVPADAINRSAQGWDGEPVMAGHPTDDDGQQVGANDPKTLERLSFGRLFHTRFNGSKLLTEAWIDLAKARRVGPEAVEVVDRLNSGDLVEVSVGTFVVLNEASGVWQGTPYHASWEEIVPDHLAMLRDGVPGACSVKMGCGAPRAASAAGGEARRGGDVKKSKIERVRALMKSASLRRVNGAVSTLLAASDEELTALEERAEKGDEVKPTSVVSRVMCAIRGAAEPTGDSDTDLRSKIASALSDEPGFVGVDTVFPEDGVVVYAVMTGERMLFTRRSFTVAEGGEVTLGDDAEEVVPVTRFETVEKKGPTAASGRGAASVKKPAKEVGKTMTKKEIVAEIIASGKTVFTSEDAPALEQLSDERIKALQEASKLEVKEVKQDVKPEPVPAAAAAKAVTEEEWLESAPESVKQVFAEARDIRARKRSQLVAAMKATGQKSFTEDELMAMDLTQLEKVARLANAKVDAAPSAVDFSARATEPRAAAERFAPPPPRMFAKEVKA